jgi:hypothetical protein
MANTLVVVTIQVIFPNIPGADIVSFWYRHHPDGACDPEVGSNHYYHPFWKLQTPQSVVSS